LNNGAKIRLKDERSGKEDDGGADGVKGFVGFINKANRSCNFNVCSHRSSRAAKVTNIGVEVAMQWNSS
jgi:DNA gyrase subunit B